jgi:hypothetical protein
MDAVRLTALLAIVCAPIIVACDGAAATPSSTASPARKPEPTRSQLPTPTASPTPTPAPALAPSPPPMSDNLDLAGSTLRQGGLIVARLTRPPEGLASAQLHFAGGVYGMTHDASIGAWIAYIGLPIRFTPGGYPIEVRSGAGAVLASGGLDVPAGRFDYTQITVPPGPRSLIYDAARVEAERQRLNTILAALTPRRLWTGAWIVPTPGTVSSNFGEHRSINGDPYDPHAGHDIANAEGTPIVAAASGNVAMAEAQYLHGNSIIIDHGVGVFSGYSHLSQMLVVPGQWVNRGDVIGYIGTSGYSNGPHLHWEATIRGVRVDPRHFMLEGVSP